MTIPLHRGLYITCFETTFSEVHFKDSRKHKDPNYTENSNIYLYSFLLFKMKRNLLLNTCFCKVSMQKTPCLFHVNI